MKLLHNTEVELSRALLASVPEGVEVVEGAGGYPVSAYPSVVVDVPPYMEQRPVFNEDGLFAGMAPCIVEGREELLRLPASWQAVDSYLAFVQARAQANPPAPAEG